MLSHNKIRKNSQKNKKFSLRLFLVRPSDYGFGAFYTSIYKMFVARSSKKAIKRYFKWYARKYKQIAPQSIYNLREVSEQWGKIEVMDCTGFRRFYA